MVSGPPRCTKRNGAQKARRSTFSIAILSPFLTETSLALPLLFEMSPTTKIAAWFASKDPLYPTTDSILEGAEMGNMGSSMLQHQAAIFVVGLISNSMGNANDVSVKKGDRIAMENVDLLAFWAPFLLVHLGGPDTITAFALKDNDLWVRHLLVVGNGIRVVCDTLGLTGFIDGIRYVYPEECTDKLKEFIFNEQKSKSELADDMETAKEISSAQGDRVLRVEEGWSSLLKYVVDVDYDQSLILCYNSELYDYVKFIESDIIKVDEDKRKIAKSLSDYMLYLLIMKPSMMSVVAGVGQIRFRDTCAEAKRFFENGKGGKQSKIRDITEGQQNHGLDRKHINACKDILNVSTEVPPVIVKGDQSKSELLKQHKVGPKDVTRGARRTNEGWAPFLLVHLGGPDTITALALKDNELWLRHLLGLVVHCVATRNQPTRQKKELDRVRSETWKFVCDTLGLTGFIDGIRYVYPEECTDKLIEFIFNELKSKSELAKEISSARELCYNSELYDYVKFIESDIIKVDEDKRKIAKSLSDYMLYLLIMKPSMMSVVAGVGQIRFRDNCAEAKRFFKDGKSGKQRKIQDITKGQQNRGLDLKHINVGILQLVNH
uniref:Calcium uniporter protein n=1 Tax=Tanacetum cinerariifolium TaxID=118510 RepID=A0A699H5G1_TANCI|nr:calcium uniporter protein [Tanacetum cinerariifolium]